MGFWSLFSKDKFSKNRASPDEPAAQDDAARAAASTADPLPRDVAHVARVGAPGGPTVDDALALFGRLRTTPDEGRAVEELVRAHAARTLPEPLSVALASALVDRGEPSSAREVLAGLTSAAALLMRADLEAQANDVPAALALAERVLLRDVDYPGARERHRKWRAALGFQDGPTREPTTGVTVVTREPDAPFSLLREIARGGAGAVYEADDRELGRKIALKIYHHAERDRAQLVHEARVAAALSGRGITRVFDIDPARGWIAMEWAPLGALRDHVRGKDRALLAPPERWARPLAEALARVHDAAWVHHDVKPANVLLAAPDAPLLTDFGIARRIGEPAPPGSMGYVSPERLKGRPSDPRDDIYGFGRLLEDVLDAIGDPPLTSRWRPLVSACIGADDQRPAHGRALATRLRVEG